MSTGLHRFALGLAFALTLTAIPALASGPDSATGEYIDDNDNVVVFNAVTHANGSVTGHLDRQGTGFYIRGPVDCLDADGPSAYIGGVVEECDFPFLIGFRFLMRVTDNGEGGGAAADSTTTCLVQATVQCDDAAAQARLESVQRNRYGGDFLVIAGNIQVRDR